MFWHIAGFEIRYWLRSWMLWIFFLIVAAAIFGAECTDNITIGAALSNTFRNAPYNILNYYSFIGLVTMLMAAAFANSAAARDFTHNTYQMVFSTPLRRFDFIAGRFVGAALVSVIPTLGVSAGILLAKYMPFVEAERFGPVNWAAHVTGVLFFAVPNGLFVAAVLFTIAVLARNEIVSFVGALVMLAGYVVGDALMQDIEHERIAALLDPFAIRTFNLVTKYWTVAEKNTQIAHLSGLLLWNRLLWLAVAAAIFLFALWRFSFTERRAKVRSLVAADDPVPVSLPAVAVHFHDAPWRKFAGSVRMHVLGVVKSTFFVVILIAALLNTVPSLIQSANEGYGNGTLPITYSILAIIAGNFRFFQVILVTYLAGALVWKDRDERMDEITDALPTPEWISFASRLTALLCLVLLLQIVVLLGGVAVQAGHGYYRFQSDLYLSELFLRDGSFFVFTAVLAFFIHALAPNKYLGYFLYIAFNIVNGLVWRPLNVATNLVQFGARPNVTYSDFFRDAPYRTAWNWYTVYWLLVCGLLAVVSIMVWPRGKQASWRQRWQIAATRFHGGWKTASVFGLLLLGATAAWITYNTRILNPLLGPKDMQRLQADYEKTYKPLDQQPQPRILSARYAIDLYPETRNMTMRGEVVLTNAEKGPLQEVHFSLARGYDTTIEVPGTELAKDDQRLLYRIYRFTTPLQPGENRAIHFTTTSRTRGFENEISEPQLMPNGTFFNNTIGPQLGYDNQRELADPNDRRDLGLKEQELMPKLERDCTADCRESYLRGHSDWVDVDTVISTTPDQIAIAPGSLVREWQANGRRYFEYKLDHPSLNFYSFISARYEVAREEWNGTRVEVYYLKEHPWNVGRMMNAIKKSLDYYERNFGRYGHKEARIIEFPRVARFAQAFPGTMPYSESIGFVANLNHPDDIDMVYYVVAHEMGHQWWAHQVVGADMEGATLLSETLAQYSALMVMEKEYGRDMMRKFLRYEMDRYLAARGRERVKERPLLKVESNQGYVHYQKGSVALYYMKEMIGEDAVNRALRKLILTYGYAPPPYPTSWALLDALRAETPPQLQYLIKDLFEDITIFSDRTLDATAHKRTDGKYDVTIQVEAHKYKADPKGNESEVAVDDWMDIGAFAKPEKGKKYGKTLHRERVHVTQEKSSYTFTVDEMPEKAGIDPFLLLVDRIPDDNLREVVMASGSN
jgi:ABC-type transport system involved in multi-copper enzyme maturation permease subunit